MPQAQLGHFITPRLIICNGPKEKRKAQRLKENKGTVQ